MKCPTPAAPTGRKRHPRSRVARWQRLARVVGAIRGVLPEATPREIVAVVSVATPPYLVWDVLTDFAAYPSWNPFVRAVTGRVCVGEHLRVVVFPGWGPRISFRVLVTAIRRHHELRWRGVFVCGWLFRGDHYFVLEELSKIVTDSPSAAGPATPGARPPATVLRQGRS